MYLEYGSSLGRKKRFKLEGGNGCVISSDKNDNVYVSSLAKESKVSVFQEADEWVMMGINCSLIVAGEECQSIDLNDGLKVTVGKQEFRVVDGFNKVEQLQDDENSKPRIKLIKKTDQTQGLKVFNRKYSKVILGTIFICVLLLLVSVQGGKDPIELEPVSVAPKNVLLGEGGVVNTKAIAMDKLKDPKNYVGDSNIQRKADFGSKVSVLNEAGVSDAEEQSVVNEGSAYSYYIDALSYYDLGFLKQAIQEVQRGLLIHPGNPLLLSKLNDWEGKLNILISQSFKDACLHALYLRNLEALQSFAMVVEMAIDTKDVRYRESVRMYKELENAAVDQRLECGVL